MTEPRALPLAFTYTNNDRELVFWSRETEPPKGLIRAGHVFLRGETGQDGSIAYGELPLELATADDARHLTANLLKMADINEVIGAALDVVLAYCAENSPAGYTRLRDNDHGAVIVVALTPKRAQVLFDVSDQLSDPVYNEDGPVMQ